MQTHALTLLWVRSLGNTDAVSIRAESTVTASMVTTLAVKCTGAMTESRLYQASC